MNDTVHLSHLDYNLQQLAAIQASADLAPRNQQASAASAPSGEHFRERKARAMHPCSHEAGWNAGSIGNDLFSADRDRQLQLRQADLMQEHRFLENFQPDSDATANIQADVLAGLNRYIVALARIGGAVAQRAGETWTRREQNRRRNAVRSRSSLATAEILLRVQAEQGAAHA